MCCGQPLFCHALHFSPEFIHEGAQFSTHRSRGSPGSRTCQSDPWPLFSCFLCRGKTKVHPMERKFCNKTLSSPWWSSSCSILQETGNFVIEFWTRRPFGLKSCCGLVFVWCFSSYRVPFDLWMGGGAFYFVGPQGSIKPSGGRDSNKACNGRLGFLGELC